MKQEIILGVVAILTIAGLLAYALHLGINGAILSLGVTAIAGLAGFEVGKKLKKKE